MVIRLPLISIQAAGARVVTVASEKNQAKLESIGADAVFDYKDAEVSEKIKAWAGTPGVTVGLDCISTKGW